KITCGVLAVVLLLGAAPSARAETTTYFTTRALLADFFPKSEKVTFRTFDLDSSRKARLRQRLGYAPAKDRYTVYIATTHGRIDGYAIVDDEIGPHQPI